MKLANILNVSPSIVTEWFLGSRNPTEEYVKKIAKLIGADENEIKNAFSKPSYFFNAGNIAGHDQCISSGLDVRVALLEKDIEIIKKDLEILKLKSKK